MVRVDWKGVFSFLLGKLPLMYAWLDAATRRIQITTHFVSFYRLIRKASFLHVALDKVLH